MKTYQVAECANGCAYHSTVGGTCAFCNGPLTAPVAMTREQARDALLHESDGRYAAGKAAVMAWMQSRA
jgi:hypothetical protein